jgi:hypothetical protein
MSWVSDITDGVGDAVGSLVSGVESMLGGGSSSSSDAASSPIPSYTGNDLLNAWDPTTPSTYDASYGPPGASGDKMANPLTVNGGDGPAPTPGSARPSPLFQGALETGALRVLGGALAPNPMAMQINAQDTWTQQAIARAKQNQNVDKVVIPHVAPTTTRRGLIGTNL